jgi:hypothetical protein
LIFSDTLQAQSSPRSQVFNGTQNAACSGDLQCKLILHADCCRLAIATALDRTRHSRLWPPQTASPRSVQEVSSHNKTNSKVRCITGRHCTKPQRDCNGRPTCMRTSESTLCINT